MNKKAFLCYVNVSDNMCFDNTDFNFDQNYLFHVEVDTSHTYYKYVLKVSKRTCDEIQPKGFWGENISTVNVITGKNGAGKTSLLRFILNQIGSGITTMHGEGVLFIVNQSGTYIVFHNFLDLKIRRSDDEIKINIFEEKEYFEQLRRAEKNYIPHDNSYFFKNLVFFSNYFGSLGLLKSDEFVINVSRDKEICKILNQANSLSELQSTTIQVAYQNYRNIRILELSSVDSFKELFIKNKVSVPDLLHFKLLNKENEYKGFYDQEKFPNNRWIGAKRYILYQKGNNERKIAFEAAINKFSVDLMLHLLQNKIINQEKFNNFINELADTEEKTGIMIARHCLESLKSEEIVKWIEILKFLDDDRKKYVLRWQSSKEFVYKWEADDIDLVRHLLSSNRSNRFFSCDLVPNATQGYYSSGEESKVNFLLSLYDALEKIRERKSEEDSRNIILLLDEGDAYFHPQYQIELINELLGIISKVFEGFYVQIILTSNTPIVLSDIPAANITYLENRKVHEEQNSVESFGSNIHILMKNKFYINTSMGVFAKKKIDNVIRFLSDQDSLCKSKEEAKYIISVIGEPIIKEKLQQMYYYKFPEDIPNQNEKIKFYKKRVDELQKYILSSNINKEALEQLETELLNITDIIRKLRG